MTDRAVHADEPDGSVIVALARAWIGTPYVHQASCRGAGTDCLGLLRGLWREFHGAEPEAVPPYSADWSETTGDETLLAAAGRHLLTVTDPAPGDVVVLRMMQRGPAKHVGILGKCAPDGSTLIHAYSGHGVVESPFGPAWARRVAGTFRFPARRT
jgi:NlpC/P60 family putative phage cell wall peptidase